MASEWTICIVCGEQLADCKCTVDELRERVNGLAHILVSFAKLVDRYNPAAINVATSILKQYEADQEKMAEEYDFSDAKRGPIERPKEGE